MCSAPSVFVARARGIAALARPEPSSREQLRRVTLAVRVAVALAREEQRERQPWREQPPEAAA